MTDAPDPKASARPLEDEWAERYVVCEHLMDPKSLPARQRFESLARFVRDHVARRWVETRNVRAKANPKRVYYLSMEYLIGRSLRNNVQNLGIDDLVRRALDREGWNLADLVEEEPDAGLGNGGLGRLAACFIDSLATLQYSAIGYGLRYEYGIFHQSIRDGYQVEQPDHWLRRPDPWEIVRPGRTYRVPLNASIAFEGSRIHIEPNHPTTLLGVAYDRPVVGWGAPNANTLRLWAAKAPGSFDFAEFSQGDFVGAVIDNVEAESLTRVLYPDDSTQAGRTLRFLQEYFLVSCSLQDVVARFRESRSAWKDLPQRAAIQMNDTHPSLSVAELMRILLDEGRLGWDEAWDLTVRTLAYTNHTLLPEALEKWPVDLFENLIPRHLEIVYEINRRFLDDVRSRFPGDSDRVRRMSLIEESSPRTVRMAHLATVGSHSVNGVAEIHSELLRTRVLRDFAEMFPTRFNNKTNGVTPRRWLRLANPALSSLITDALGGEAWVADLGRLRALAPLAGDAAFRERFRAARREAKARFSDWLRASSGVAVDPDSIFDSQIKRIHEYKRQLLNVLHIVILYNRLRANPNLEFAPRTFFFAGKAAPAYRVAKRIIKLIENVAGTVDGDPAVKGRLRVLFLPEYNVSLAERLIPASDVSEQISTAGYEASGTGNMKFMMNGALTVGTRDGATIEMAREAGEENFFLFGLTADQVAAGRDVDDPLRRYREDAETREALDLIFGNHFSRYEPGVFEPLRETLLTGGDRYRHLADLPAYAQAQARVAKTWANPADWFGKAIRNVAASGRFSSDRTITEYAKEIWGAEPCPVGGKP